MRNALTGLERPNKKKRGAESVRHEGESVRQHCSGESARAQDARSAREGVARLRRPKGAENRLVSGAGRQLRGRRVRRVRDEQIRLRGKGARQRNHSTRLAIQMRFDDGRC
eukprot:6194955-Pleurochrysis_carterae.AAC.1